MTRSAVLLLALVATRLGAQQAPIRGFPSDALPQRAQLEQRLRAVPDTARLREYQRVMSEVPHHASSSAAALLGVHARR